MTDQSQRRPDITIVGIFREWGGTYRRLLNQIHVWVQWGLTVELVTFRDGVQFYPDEVPDSVRKDRPCTADLKGVDVTRIYTGSVSLCALERANEPLDHPLSHGGYQCSSSSPLTDDRQAGEYAVADLCVDYFGLPTPARGGS